MTPAQTAVNRTHWTRALRSRDFVQGRKVLCDRRGRLCVMGVACEVFRQHTGRGKWTDPKFFANQRAQPFEVDGQWSNIGLPAEVRDWYGLATTLGDFAGKGGCEKTSLARLSDRGRTFEQLAHVIEVQPLGLLA